MEFLKEILGDDLYSQVEAKLKGNDKYKLANLATGEYVGKDKFQTADNARKEAETQLKDRDKQLEELKKSAGDNKALQEQITKLQADNDKVAKDFAAKLGAQAVDFAIDTALLKAGGKNAKAIKALLDASKVKIDGDKVLGLDDQIEALKKSDAYLFGSNNPGDPGNPPANPPPPGTKTPKQEYDEALKAAQANPNDQSLRQRLFALKEKLNKT